MRVTICSWEHVMSSHAIWINYEYLLNTLFAAEWCEEKKHATSVLLQRGTASFWPRSVSCVPRSYMDAVSFHSYTHTKPHRLCVDNMCQCHCAPWQHCQYWTNAKEGLFISLFDVLLPSVSSNTVLNKIIITMMRRCFVLLCNFQGASYDRVTE